LLDASKQEGGRAPSVLGGHALRDVFVDLILQVKLKLFAEIQLRFVLAKQGAQAKWQFVIPTHGCAP
jgi:hypothetical protein